MTAKTPTTYTIKVITNFDDCEPQYDLFDFTTNKVTKAKGADTLFIEAVKDAVGLDIPKTIRDVATGGLVGKAAADEKPVLPGNE